MEHEQQQWTESVLRSLDGMERAKMPASLRERLMNALPEARKRTIILSRPAMWAMAAGLALLIGLNVYSLVRHESSAATAISVQVNPVANEYFTPPPSI